MKKNLRTILALVLVMAVVLTTGCGGKPSGEDTIGVEKDSIVVSMASDIINLDPQGHEDIYCYLIDAQIFDTLLYMDETGNYQMMLAETMTQSPDAMKMTVKIKEGIKFSNGEELKASDVKYSFDRGIGSTKFGKVAMIEGVDVVDDYTVDINFKTPTAYMEQPISGVFIVNEKAVAAVGNDFGNSIDGVIGTGAYVIQSWVKGQELTFTRNEDYWQGPAPIKDLSIKVIGDFSTAALALEKGEIDYLYDADPTLEKTLADAKNVKTVSGTQNALTFMMMNCSKAPFDDVNLRKAVAYAINRDDIVTVARNGNAAATGNFVLDTMPGQAKDVVSPNQDLKKAKEYLAKSAYADGLKITFLSGEPETEKIGAAVQGMLAEIGITVELQAMEFGTALDKVFAGDYEISALGLMNMMSPDHYYNWLHSQSGMSIFHYTDPKLDKIMEDGRAETDEAKRTEIYREMQEILRDQQVFVPLYMIKQYMFVNEDLEGVKIFPVMVPHFRELSWK